MSETPTPKDFHQAIEWLFSQFGLALEPGWYPEQPQIVEGIGDIMERSNELYESEHQLATALAANQRLEKERDEIKREHRRVFTEFEGRAMKMADQLRAKVASLTAERDDLIQHFDIKQGTISDAMKRLDVQNRNTAAERDRLMADVVQYRRALEVAQLWLCNCMPIIEIEGPTPLPLIAEALATEHPGAPLVDKIGKAYEALREIKARSGEYCTEGMAQAALDILEPFISTKPTA